MKRKTVERWNQAFYELVNCEIRRRSQAGYEIPAALSPLTDAILQVLDIEGSDSRILVAAYISEILSYDDYRARSEVASQKLTAALIAARASPPHAQTTTVPNAGEAVRQLEAIGRKAFWAAKQAKADTNGGGGE